MGWLGNLIGGVANVATGGVASKAFSVAKGVASLVGRKKPGGMVNGRGNRTQSQAAAVAVKMQPFAKPILMATKTDTSPQVMPGGAPFPGGARSASGTKRKRRRRKATSSRTGRTRKRASAKKRRGSRGKRKMTAKQLKYFGKRKR